MSAVMTLLDHRYRVTRGISLSGPVRCFAGVHDALDIPVRIYAMPLAAPATTPIHEGSAMRHQRMGEALRLRHTAVAQVRDYFYQGQQLYIVTEDIPGETLSNRIQRPNRLALRQTLLLGLRLCDVLASVARTAPSLLPVISMTPASVTRISDDDVVLTDIGVEHWGQPAAPVAPAYLPYLAPEVVLGEKPDMPALLYSLAALLYALLAGEPPVPCGLGRLPVEQIESLVPEPISGVLERALQLDPGQRHGSAEEFGSSLASAIREILPVLTQARRRYTSPAPAQTLALQIHTGPHAVLPASHEWPAPPHTPRRVHGISRITSGHHAGEKGSRTLAKISSVLGLHIMHT